MLVHNDATYKDIPKHIEP